jgi:hypothetical protein
MFCLRLFCRSDDAIKDVANGPPLNLNRTNTTEITEVGSRHLTNNGVTAPISTPTTVSENRRDVRHQLSDEGSKQVSGGSSPRSAASRTSSISRDSLGSGAAHSHGFHPKARTLESM